MIGYRLGFIRLLFSVVCVLCGGIIWAQFECIFGIDLGSFWDLFGIVLG